MQALAWGRCIVGDLHQLVAPSPDRISKYSGVSAGTVSANAMKNLHEEQHGALDWARHPSPLSSEARETLSHHNKGVGEFNRAHRRKEPVAIAEGLHALSSKSPGRVQPRGGRVAEPAFILTAEPIPPVTRRF